MKCPVCKNVDLVISERRGIEIDYCPACRGVWLDRGELDKIIERNDSYNSSGTKNSMHDTDTHNDSRHKDFSKNQQPQKKESFMANIFDVFGGE